MEHSAVTRQQIETVAGAVFPAAAVALYSKTGAQHAVTEAVTAAMRKGKTSDLYPEALRRLMQICNARSGETPQEDIFPADSPMTAAAKLPYPSRADFALLTGGVSDADAAAVLRLSQDELKKRYEKALRQMAFLRDGAELSPEECQAETAALLTPEIRDALTEKIMQTEKTRIEEEQKQKKAEQKPAEQTKIRQIVRNVPPAERAGNGVTVPVWAMVTAAAVLVLMTGALIVLGVKTLRGKNPAQPPAEDSLPASVVQRAEELKYLGMAKAQQTAAEAAGVNPEAAVYLNTKLTADGDQICYEVRFAVQGGDACTCKLDAVSGALLSKESSREDYVPDTAGWMARETLRSMALEYAGLEKAVFRKEKLGGEGDQHYYKYEFTDSSGKEYSVQELTANGALLKYEVKEPRTDDDQQLISLERAREQVLTRIGAAENQVIFTKEKLEGTVWLISVTLDDGTQYTVELNAQNGNVNTVDAHPFTADVSNMTGLLAASRDALRKAGLPDDGSVRFTKAKIDRSGGAYVYELAFETSEYEYEVTLHAQTGELLRFRAAAV